MIQRKIQAALEKWEMHEYHEPFSIGEVTVEFLDAGHILGSAMARFSRGDKSVIFTGDLGNSPEPLLKDTESPEGANYLVMESVYGDRVHEDRDSRTDTLMRAIEDTRSRKGTLLVPSFSIERTQIILFEIHKLVEEKKIAPISVYLDAPLGQRITDVFRQYKTLLNEKAQEDFRDGDIFSFKGLVESGQHQSGNIHAKPNPKIIIAGAGMSNGGRIRSHERHYLPDKNAAVLLTGYQAPGSLGRRIQDGDKNISIDGERVRVEAVNLSHAGNGELFGLFTE